MIKKVCWNTLVKVKETISGIHPAAVLSHHYTLLVSSIIIFSCSLYLPLGCTAALKMV